MIERASGDSGRGGARRMRSAAATISSAIRRAAALNGGRARRARSDISAVLDCAGAINNLSGLIEFKR
jgi:hypothetical protein